MLRYVLIGLMVLSGNAWAKGEKYRIGVENISYLPYYRTDKDQYNGFARELLDSFAKAEGIQFEYVPEPVVRLYSNFFDKKSTLDFKFPDRPNWASDKRKDLNITYSNDVVEFIDGVMTQPTKVGKGVANLKTLGTVRGFTPWDYLQWIDKPGAKKDGMSAKAVDQPKIKLMENDSMSGLLSQVDQGRIDGAYVNVAVARYILQNELKMTDKVVFDKDLPHTASAYQLSTTKHPELIKKFNAFMVDKKGDIAALKQKWGL